MPMNDLDMARLKEQVELLSARRGAEKRPLSAVRRGELVQLANRPMGSDQVTAAPTMDQYNALQADVRAVYDLLAQISNALGNAKMLQGN
jgi:hypothetical protein